MRSGGRARAWARLALTPVAIVLVIVGVWLLPAVTSLGGTGAVVAGLAWTGAVVVLLRTVRSGDLPAGERDDVIDELFLEPDEKVAWLTRFVTLLTLSAVIATLGLISDSTAVVIGAMVVAPLMAPLMSLAGGLTLARPARTVEAAAIVIAGSALTVAVAIVLSWLVPGVALTSEVTARTQPGLTDLGIALAAGAAGGYVTVRRRHLGALPGVAIAVALVPPLATLGILLELAEWRLAEEALILFATNAAAIVLAAAIVFVILGLTASAAEIRSRRRIQTGLVIAVLATLIVMVPLAHNTVDRYERTQDEHDVQRALSEQLAPRSTVVDDVVVTRPTRETDEIVTVRVEVSGPEPPPSAELAVTAADVLDSPVALDLRWRYGDRALARP